MTTEVLPDVDVDESELTQQPCVRRPYGNKKCGRPSVGEDVLVCEHGHNRVAPQCSEHIGNAPRRKDGSPNCCFACWPDHACVLTLVVSRYYSGTR